MRMSGWLLAAALSVAACGETQNLPVAETQSAPAPTAASETASTPYEMPASAVHRIESAALGRSYDVYVKLPPGYDAEENASRRYPVLYTTDGHYPFQTAAGVTMAPMTHGGFEHVIVVGVSYAVGENGGASRGRDLTPVSNPNSQNVTGGASAFLVFLRDEVTPLVDATYRTDALRRIYAGQSYGGLFGAYALLQQPGIFSDYILTSPSLWFAEGAMFGVEAEFAKTHSSLPARVYFAIGQTETPAVSGGRYDMVGDQKRFADQLRSRGYEGLAVRDAIVEDGTHLTTFPIGLLRGLMWLAPGPKPYGG